jgi:hypothetical protein
LPALLFLMLTLPFTFHGQNPYDLYGTKQDGKVILYWDCRSWSHEQQGFWLMRSAAGKGQWEMMQTAPVVPSIDSLKDYTLQGATSEETGQVILPALRRLINEGKLLTLTAEDMRRVLNQHNGLGSGDRIRMKRDFHLALIMGFAYIDHTAHPDSAYDYALFESKLDGTIGNTPLDTLRIGDPSPLDFEVDFSVSDRSITLNWSIPAPEAKALALTGFLVDRRNADGSNIQKIHTEPSGSTTVSENLARYRITDPDADPTLDYWYTLTPVNLFRQVGKPVEADYLAEKYRPLNLPQIAMIQLQDETDLGVTWEVNPSDEIHIRGFVVEVSTEMDGRDAKVVSDTLPGNARAFTDKGLKEYGKVYYYRVTAIGKHGQTAGSAPEATYYMGLIKPPEVRDLRAMLVKAEGKVYVNLVWKGKEAGDTLTDGYNLYNDELIPDSLLHISALPLIKDNHCLYPINTQGGRNYRFKVAGVSKHGKTGDAAEVCLKIGTLKMPRVTTVTCDIVNRGNLLVKWEYPEIADLDGFRILINDKEVAGPKTIDGKMRSYLLTSPPEPVNQELVIQLVAVGSETESEKGLRKVLYLNEPFASELPAPSSLIFEYISTSYPEIIQLCWTPPFSTETTIVGYALFADYAGNGKLYRMNSVPVIKEPTYIFTNDKRERSSINLGIAAIYANGKTGRIKSVNIPIKDTELNINQQR